MLHLKNDKNNFFHIKLGSFGLILYLCQRIELWLFSRTYWKKRSVMLDLLMEM